MKLYKLTNQNGKTRSGKANETQWGRGVTHGASGEGKDLCSNGWIHAYEDPYVAVFMNPIHAAFPNPLLWDAEGEGKILREGDLHCGVKELTTLRQIPISEISIAHRVEVAIRCAMLVYNDKDWLLWAEKWLSGEDRSEASGKVAGRAARAAGEAAWAAWAAGTKTKFSLKKIIYTVLKIDKEA